jgi:hypothetical protein
MNRHENRPGCYVVDRTALTRSVGVDRTKICSQVETPQTWKETLDKTPGCSGCWRAYVTICGWSDADRQRWRRGKV